MPVMQLSSIPIFLYVVNALIVYSAALGASGANTSFDYVGRLL